MKQTLNYLTAAVIILAASFNSCKKKDEPVKEDVDFLYNLKNVYEILAPQKVTEAKNNPTTRNMYAIYDGGKTMAPDWDEAKVSAFVKHLQTVKDLDVLFGKSVLDTIYFGGFTPADSGALRRNFRIFALQYVDPDEIPRHMNLPQRVGYVHEVG